MILKGVMASLNISTEVLKKQKDESKFILLIFYLYIVKLSLLLQQGQQQFHRLQL